MKIETNFMKIRYFINNKIILLSYVIKLSFFLIMPLCFDLNILHAQNKTVSELYYFSMVSPNNTDQFINNNQLKSNAQFFKCLLSVRNMVGIQGANYAKYCDGLEGLPDDRAAKCRLQNWALGIYFWTLSIEETIVNDIPWTETLVGRTAVMADQQGDLLEQIIPGFKESSREITRAISQTLVCHNQ